MATSTAPATDGKDDVGRMNRGISRESVGNGDQRGIGRDGAFWGVEAQKGVKPQTRCTRSSRLLLRHFTIKAHLSPRQHIANKGGENTQEQEEHTHTPHKHAPCMAQSEAAEQMQVDREKEQTRTVGVGMAEQPPAVDLAQNVFYGHSGTNHVGRVVHRKNDAGQAERSGHGQVT